MAEVSYTLDPVTSLEKRKEMLEKLTHEAMSGAVNKAANMEKVQILDMQNIPYHYVPGHQARVKITASGQFVMG